MPLELKSKYLIPVLIFCNCLSFSQASNFDLLICKSSDGINWTNNALFEAAGGVPSAAQHSTGVIFCVFQWFPSPQNQSNPSFDKIAVKQSSDGGLSWSAPQTITINGYPPNFKRPFDPTIVLADNGNLRLYFSGSKNGLLQQLDSTVHTYSAISPDGVNYSFEGVRVLVKDSITIDPAVGKFGNVWHYTSPRAAPQAGAHHFISADGMAWTRTTTVASDMNHNWTGNMLVDGPNIKFYGTPNPQTNAIWCRQTGDGYNWAPYINCVGALTTSGIQADPTVVKPSANNYVMIYVSKQNLVGLQEGKKEKLDIIVYPNPATDEIHISSPEKIINLKIFDYQGKTVFQSAEKTDKIMPGLVLGLYIMEITTVNARVQQKVLIE